MSNQPQDKKNIIFVDVQLKNGKTVKVNIDELGEFWATHANQLEISYGNPRPPRRIKTSGRNY